MESVADSQPSSAPADPTPSGPECVEDADCADSAEGCIEGACLDQDCQSLLDCPAFAVCDDLTNRCVECTGSLDCEATEVCVDQRCVSKCTRNADCLPQVCPVDGDLCRDCQQDEECPPGLSCTSQGCMRPDAGVPASDAGP